MGSRAKGLWWKEWRQLRLLRVVGASLIFVAPLMLLSAAEGAKRGWLPLAALQNYSAATVVQDALPMFLGLLIWPLLAALFVAQSFCGDIASGTEWFWMARPVKPRRVWTTRLLAAAASLVGVIALHWIVWRLLVVIWGDASAFDAVGANTRWFLMNQFQVTASGAALTAGLMIAIAAFLSTLAASAFARSPMQALPLALIFLALPLGLGQLFAGMLPLTSFNHEYGFLRPLPLFFVYVFVSYFASCRGEPAGRRRLVRALTVLAIGTAVLVAVVTPANLWMMRRAEMMSLGESIVDASPTGDRFFVYTQWTGSGWLHDVESGDELLHLRASVFDVAWNADGDRLALARFSERDGIVLDVYDRDGQVLVDSLPCDRCGEVSWAGDRVAVETFHGRMWGLDWIDTTTGARTPLDVRPGVLALEMIGPAKDGAMYVARPAQTAGESATGPWHARPTLFLHALDLATYEVGEPVTVQGLGRYFRIRDLAPDGSALLLERQRESLVLDLASATAKEIGWHSAWLYPNRPVWAERIGESFAILTDEDGEVREMRRFEGHGMVELLSAPDGRSLLFVRSPAVSIPGGLQELEHWFYDLDTDTWTELDHTKVDDVLGWPVKPAWANNDTLVLRGAAVLALCDPGDPASLRYLKGG